MIWVTIVVQDADALVPAIIPQPLGTITVFHGAAKDVSCWYHWRPRVRGDGRRLPVIHFRQGQAPYQTSGVAELGIVPEFTLQLLLCLHLGEVIALTLRLQLVFVSIEVVPFIPGVFL